MTNNRFDFLLPDWAKNATIYEVNVRQYTEEGTIQAFLKHIPRLKKMGITILWLMPIFPISTTKRKGTLGSYYSVSDYKAINPEFGTMEDMQQLILLAHENDMKVILDWVPNHTGWDHAWIKTNPEYYQQNDRGEIIDPLDGYGNSCGWEDTAGLNYANPSLRAAMIEELLFWIREYKIDGYRMDIAFLVPHYFWLEAKEALVAAKSDIFMLAEADRPEHLNEGAFHACYGWSFHYIMNCIARGEKNVYDIEHWVWNEKSKMQQGSFMHFTSNHDENTWHGDEYERMGEAAAKSFAVLTMLWDGIPLIYSGQEEPLKKRLEFFEKDNIGFDKFELQDFYAKLVHLKNKRPCLWNLPYGAHAHMISHHSHVYAFRRQVGNDRIAVVLNLSMETQSAVLDENISGYDLFTNKYYTFPQGSELILEPWQYLILT